MSGWTIFAICFTALLLLTGSAFTLLEFYRADERPKDAQGYGSTGQGEGSGPVKR